MELRAWAKSDVGNVREDNEDSIFVDPRQGVFAVSDGVGGRERGDVASRIVTNSLRESAADLAQLASESDPLDDPTHRERVLDGVREHLSNANKRVFEQSQAASSTSNMAATAEVLLLSRGSAYVGHVGDSRIYMIRGGRIFRITEDHTYAEYMRRHGDHSARELADSNERFSHVLTRSVGSSPHIDVDTLFLDVLIGDKFLLCSDGLTDYLTGSEILQHVVDNDGEQLVDSLVDTAKKRGGKDNISVVAVEVLDDGATAEVPARSMDTIRKVGFLEKIDLFEGLRPLELVKILRVVYERSYEKGETVIELGDKGNSLYMIAEGAISLEIQGQELTQLEAGQHFGELALFGRQDRSATARCVTDALLLSIPSDEFERLVEQNAELGRKLLWNLLRNAAQQIRRMNERVVYEFGETLEIRSPFEDDD
ncbi:MAG: cyclic nucleotide-binding domain-containing protein [Myxococcota bacterium]